MYRIRRIILPLIFLMLLASCGETTSLSVDTLTIDTLTASGHELNSAYKVPDLDAVSYDTTKIHQLLHHISSLRSIEPGTVFYCPADWGYDISLTFLFHGKKVLMGTVGVAGCRMLSLSNGNTYLTDDMFWTLLEKCIGQSISHQPPLLAPTPTAILP